MTHISPAMNPSIAIWTDIDSNSRVSAPGFAMSNISSSALSNRPIRIPPIIPTINEPYKPIPPNLFRLEKPALLYAAKDIAAR